MTSQSQARTIGLLRPLRDIAVTAGETAKFDCELSYEGIAVEWFVGTKKVEPSDSVSFRDKYLYIFMSLIVSLNFFIQNYTVRFSNCAY